VLGFTSVNKRGEAMTFQKLRNTHVLTVPGLDGSGPQHWQTLWERRLPRCERVQMGDWAYPQRSKWVRRLDQEIRSSPAAVLIAAHSLGCLAVAWWAKERWSLSYQDRVTGALLVAPPDVERGARRERMDSFVPIPREPLPFPSLLVASRDDPYARFETSSRIAAMWGSELIDAGSIGHINTNSGIAEWAEGARLLAGLIPRDEPEGPLWQWEKRSSEESDGQPLIER
jgi:predicted alpha/beta hydrolase family esterase